MTRRLVLILPALLAACASPPPETAIKQPFSVRPQPMATQTANGAIYQAGNSQPRPGMALFEDRRARFVGDTLIVNLVEKTEVKRKSESTDERKANGTIDIPAPTVLGRSSKVLGATSWTPAASNKIELKDNETNSNSVTGSITVTVVEVLANGNLVVAGEKQVAVNADTEYIRLAGVVNPAQITASNTINSTQLANVQFESKNTQGIDKSQLTSMLARFFLTILPF